MTTLQKKSSIKIAKTKRSQVKFVPLSLYIFSEVQKNTFEIQDIAQVTADVIVSAGKLFCYVYLKRREFTKISLTLEFG